MQKQPDEECALFAGAIVMTSLPDRAAQSAAAGDDALTAERRYEPSYTRYCDQPMHWRTRMAGLGGASTVFLAIAFATFFTWRTVQPMVAPPTLSVFDVTPPAAPPEPVRQVPDGPQQVEQKEQKPQEQERPEPPEIIIPRLSPATVPFSPPVEQVTAADPVPETTSPKSLPAPPAKQASNNAEATWEALLLAHLEKYRRYPATARARREEGVSHVRFSMNRAGKLLSVELLRSSGSVALDRAALDTLRRAQPLPAIPEGKSDPLTLSVPVEFFMGR